MASSWLFNKFFQNCGESVTSIYGGVVGSAGYDELLVTTYTGKTLYYIYLKVKLFCCSEINVFLIYFYFIN